MVILAVAECSCLHNCLSLQYLSTPESQSLRADLIRYIVGVVHPSNEVLCSDIIPRWAIIGWLLTSCQVSLVTPVKQVSAAQANVNIRVLVM